jgi:prepilin-type processing-associated H-X9-DG protein
MAFNPARCSFDRALCLVLSVALAIGPSAKLWAQQTAQESGAEIKLDLPSTPMVQINEAPSRENLNGDKTLLAAPNAGKIDLTYVTPQAAALVALRPHQLLTSPNTAIFPVEVVSAAGIEHLGVDPADLVEVVLFVEPPSIMGLQYGAVFKFAKPFALDDLKEQLRARMQPSDFAGKTYLRSENPQQPSLYMPDDRTLLAMPDITLRKTLAPLDASATSPLLERVAGLPGGNDLYAMIDVESLRPLIVPWMNVAVAQKEVNFPEEAKPFLEIPNLIASIDLAFNITNPGPTLLALHADNAASADRLEALYDLAQDLQRQNAAKNAAELQKSNDPIQRAFGDYLERMSKSNFDTYKYQRHDDDLILFEIDGSNTSPQNQMIIVAVTGILVAMLLPAVQAAREAARRNQSLSQLKQLMLSMHVYADLRKVLPPHASYSPDGKPLLSWRVHMLPYLEETALYNQFHLDEPWDSPHNRTLIEKMPDVFNNPNVNEPGKTIYLALVGPECVLDGSTDGMRFAKITDGTSRTIVLVEADADQAVEWTNPDDIKFDPKNPHAGFGNLRPGGSNAGWADGHASFIANDIDPALLKAMITRNGGETIPQ